MISRQRKLQLHYKSLNLCIYCGKVKRVSKYLCDSCLLKLRLRNRRIKKCKPWKKGSARRPPLQTGLNPSSVTPSEEQVHSLVPCTSNLPETPAASDP